MSDQMEFSGWDGPANDEDERKNGRSKDGRPRARRRRFTPEDMERVRRESQDAIRRHALLFELARAAGWVAMNEANPYLQRHEQPPWVGRGKP